MEYRDDLVKRIKLLSINHNINCYADFVSSFPLPFTNKVFFIYFNKEKISLEDKLKTISKYIDAFKSFFDRRVKSDLPNDLVVSVYSNINCMLSHIEEIKDCDDYLGNEVSYWQLISDFTGCEMLTKHFYPKTYKYDKIIHRMIPVCFLDINGFDYEIKLDNPIEDGEEWKNY